MKNLTWQNPEQLFVAQELINKVKSKCCGIKDEYKATNGCSFVKEHNGLILHSAKRCKNSHFGTFYHWEDMANYRGTISFCPNCMKVELIQAYNDSVNSYR